MGLRVFRILDVYVLKKMSLLFSLVFASLLLVFYIITIIDLRTRSSRTKFRSFSI